MDVLTAAYTATHPPAHPPGDRITGQATSCGRCGRKTAAGILASKVVSKVFTAYDRWHDCTATAVLCPTCTWGYRTPQLRLVPHLVLDATADLEPRLQALTASDVVDVLTAPLNPRAALVVPLRPGRKHLLPDASWGYVTVDDAQLSWTAADADCLHTVQRLRAAGFGSRQLAEPAPPYPVLRRTPTSSWTQTVADWAQLTPWRTGRLWLDLACAITIPHPMAPPAPAATPSRPSRAAA